MPASQEFAPWMRKKAGYILEDSDAQEFYDALANLAAQMLEALVERPPEVHDPGCSAGISRLPCKCSHKDTVAAIQAANDLMERYRD